MIFQKRNDVWRPSRVVSRAICVERNVYDFVRIDVTVRTQIIGFVEEALVVCVTEDVETLELRINESLQQVK